MSTRGSSALPSIHMCAAAASPSPSIHPHHHQYPTGQQRRRSAQTLPPVFQAGMDMDCGAGALMPFPGTKRKAAEAALDDGRLSDGDSVVAVDAPAAAQQGASEETAPRRPKAIMSQEWIVSVLANQNKPLPLKERHLRDPKLAAIFHSHEQSRAKFVEYQNWIRRELETKGYVEVDDDYEERCELLHAVHKAVFYGRGDEEKEAMAKLAALRRA